jgi:hypothetical protein
MTIGGTKSLAWVAQVQGYSQTGLFARVAPCRCPNLQSPIKKFGSLTVPGFGLFQEFCRATTLFHPRHGAKAVGMESCGYLPMPCGMVAYMDLWKDANGNPNQGGHV